MLLSATNIVKAKAINLWVVFEAIRVNDAISRSDISDATGLSKQAVSDLVDELADLAFVEQRRKNRSGVGKPPTLVSIRPDGAFTLGVDVEFDRLMCVAMNFAGDVLYRADAELRDLRPEHAALDIAATARQVIAMAGIPEERLLGIGLATPGPFAVPGLAPPRLPDWDGIKLRELLVRSTGLKVSLANDGQCAITAEWRFGETARHLSNFVYVSLGMGLGCGVMINGAAFGGASGNAGELAHTTAVPGGNLCICGKRGCLETYVSIDSALRYLSEHGLDLPSPDAFDLLGPDHPLVKGWLDEAVEPLRTGLNTLENLFDPETIMLGGNAPAWLIDTLIARVQPLAPSVGRAHREMPPLVKASLGRDSVARGAAALPILATLNPQYRQLTPFALNSP
ncbi:MAG: ROK family transcriptional regulator [Bauldia sp.]|nr:ROK family transcriptional regulator [Bauldia sp.]